jgi:hypothetical protein
MRDGARDGREIAYARVFCQRIERAQVDVHRHRNSV